jgi:hypothetical protein
VDLHYPRLISEKLNLASSISTGIAVTSIIKFYAVLKPHITQNKTLLKIVAFKLVVGVTFFEAVSQKSEPAYITTDSNTLAHILGPPTPA